ncbi:MAG: RNA polymerase subunit sigma-24 [Gemmatimonadetes bacterium]|nr:MAG: RNA polymerase subunit sigma-24 [Gemmatimonadota bacterium]
MSPESFDDAFHALFVERSASLYRYVHGVSGDPALSEDIVQECFVKLHRRRAMPDDPRAWLVTVANNLLRDAQRRVVRRRRLTSAWSTDLPLGGAAPQPDDPALAAERIESVRRALDKLSLRDRQLLLLRHQGYRYQEIATALELTRSSVGTMLVRAGEAFRKAYHELFGTSR